MQEVDSRVLIVEDEAIVAEDLSHKITALGYKVVGVVPTGEEAICAAKDSGADLILLDLQLAGNLNGVQTAKQLHQLCDTAIVFVTAHSDLETVETANATSPVGYILKPFSDRDLAIQLAVALHKHRADRALRAEIAERQQAQKQLQKSEAILLRAQWGAKAGVWEIDLRTGQFTWSKPYYDLFDLDRSLQPSLAVWLSRIHPEDRSRMAAQHQESIERHRDQEMEFRIVRSDGSIRWIHRKGQVEFNEQGEAIRINGISFDITERKHAEEAVSAIALFPAQNPSPLLRVTGSGVLIYMNPASQGLLEELDLEIGQPLPPDLQAWVQQSLERGRSITVEYALGSCHYVITVTPIVKEQYANLYWTDITDRKLAEEQLLRNQGTLLELVHRSPFGIYIVDSAFRIAHMNDAGQRGAFRNVRPVIGRDFAEVMRILWPEAVAADIITIFRQTLETGKPYSSSDFMRMRGDIGVVEAYEWELHRVMLPEGRYGVICYYFDSTRLREAEQALRRSEEQRDLVSNTVPALIFYLDPEYRYRSVNDAFTAWFGLRREEILGRTVRELIGDKAWEVIQPRLDRAYAGEAMDYEIEVLYRLGGARWIHAVYTPHRDPAGIVIGVIALVTDITRRKQIEEAFRESEERFRYIFETVGTSIFEEDWVAVRDLLTGLRASGVTDLRTYLDSHPQVVTDAISLVKIIDVNAYTLHLFGAATKDALLGSLDQIFVPETQQVFKEELIAVWEGRDIFRCEAPLRTISGEDLSVLFTLVVPKKDDDWKRVLVTVADVTALQRAQASLRESEQRLRAFLENSATIAWLKDEEGRHVFLSSNYEKRFGARFKDWRDKTDFDLWPPEIAEEFQRSDRHVLASDSPLEAIESAPNPDGSMSWWLNNKFTFRDSSGRRYVGGLGVDITERKRVEQALHEAQERLQRWGIELEQAVTAKTAELLESEDHLRALATELNLAEQRERKRLAMELHDHLQQMLVFGKMAIGQGKRYAVGVPACENLLNKLENVLTEALIYTRTLVADLSPPALRDHGLAAGLKWLGESMKKHDLRVTVTVPEIQTSKLPEDQTLLLFQSVRELLINAAKHAGTGHATVEMAEEPGRLQITVRDEGGGFNPAAAGAAVTTSTAGISSKFGLFSIRERMKALGAWFDIQSSPGKGTCATLALPLPTLSGMPPKDQLESFGPHADQRGNENSSRKQTSSIRVLLVDDHIMVRQGLRTILTGYQDLEVVGEAANGIEALDAVEQHQPAVVIMDINMPHMGGIEATERIKARYPAIHIIGLSVNSGKENQEAMHRAGASLLLNKEGAVEELYSSIQAALNQQSVS